MSSRCGSAGSAPGLNEALEFLTEGLHLVEQRLLAGVICHLGAQLIQFLAKTGKTQMPRLALQQTGAAMRQPAGLVLGSEGFGIVAGTSAESCRTVVAAESDGLSSTTVEGIEADWGCVVSCVDWVWNVVLAAFSFEAAWDTQSFALP